MSARQEILDGKFKTSPSAVAALRAAGGAGTTPELFASFVGYACAQWSYAAQSGAQKAQDLLDGDGAKTVACGLVGSAIGFVAGFAWKTRDLTEGMAHSAAKQMGVVRDQHWLERHPIDYA